jgi:hypothetical protein
VINSWQEVAEIRSNPVIETVVPPVVIDTEKPVIVLNGENPINLEVQSTYVESGAVVTDNIDTDLVATITGQVDTETVGTYLIYYNASDKSGNIATEVSRNIIVNPAP